MDKFLGFLLQDENRKVLRRYKKINGKNIIELSIKNADYLFDNRDPAPFRDKDLDEDAAKYIVTSLRELPEDEESVLKLYITQPRTSLDNENILKESIRRYFEYESEIKRIERNHIIKQALRALKIGLTFLFVFIYSSSFLKNSSGIFYKYLEEGLHLLGWVSMWKPIYYTLYEWWPAHDEMKLLRRASELEIEIAYHTKPILISPHEAALNPLLALKKDYHG